MSNNLIHTPVGVRDVFGKEYRKKLVIQDKIHSVIASYGFEDIQTPAFEFFDVFSKEIGTTPSKELYKFFDKEGNTLVLRPDFTPSIARCAAKYFPQETAPIRFSYLGNTYTNTSELQGKLKEMTEMGAELVNDNSVEADAEMIALVVDSLLSTGLTEFQVSVGEVDYFRGLCEQAGLDPDTELALRDCVSIKNFFGAEELLSEHNVSQEDIDAILKVYDLFGQVDILHQAKENLKNEVSLRAIDRLEKLYEVLCLYGVEKYVSFDLGMLSKYHYYTGVIFKAFTYGVGDVIVKGGRYDKLLNKFGKESPAIGFVILIDDLMTALSFQKIEIRTPEDKQILYYTEQDYSEKLKIAKELRLSGQKVSLQLVGKNGDLK